MENKNLWKKLALFAVHCSDVGHDMNNRLAVMSGYLENLEKMLLDRQSPVDWQKLQKIHEKINMSYLRLLELSRSIQEVKNGPISESSNISSAVKRWYKLLENEFKSKNLQFIVFSEKEIHLKLHPFKLLQWLDDIHQNLHIENLAGSLIVFNVTIIEEDRGVGISWKTKGGFRLARPSTWGEGSPLIEQNQNGFSLFFEEAKIPIAK